MEDAGTRGVPASFSHDIAKSKLIRRQSRWISLDISASTGGSGGYYRMSAPEILIALEKFK